MTIATEKKDELKVSFLIILNSYFFWFVIQILRLIPITVDFIIQFFLILLIALILDFFLQKFFMNLIMVKISFVCFTFILIFLYFTDFYILFPFIIISYGIFFPGFYDYVLKSKNNSSNKYTILIVFSFIFSFIANLFERYFLLTFNPIIVNIITPILCFLLFILINKRNRKENEKQEPSSVKFKMKMRLFSIVHTFIIACILSFQIIIFNNPSLIGVSSFFNYDFTVFFILLSYFIFIIISLFLSFQFNAKDKKFRVLIIIINSVVLLTFVVNLLFQSPFQIIFFLLSNFLILFLLVFIFAHQNNYKIKSSFMASFAGNLVIYLLCSLFGLVFFFILIDCLIMFLFSILLLPLLKQELSISMNLNRSKNFKQLFSLIIIGILIMSMIPIFRMIINNSREPYDRRVLAFYYTWYGNQTDYTNGSLGITDPLSTFWFHWNNEEFPNPTPNGYSGTNAPKLGLYDSNDPVLIEKHFNMASAAGIDGFICTWWGINTPEDKTFNNLLTMADNLSASIKLTVYFETNQERFYKANISDAIDVISSEVKYILETYSSSPYFFKENGKPVIFFYTSFLFTPLVWYKIITNIKNAYDCYLIADIVPVPEVRTELFSSFDGIHIYNPTYFINEQRKLSLNKTTYGTIGDIYKSMALTAQSYNKICALTAIPGYDDRVIRDPGILISRENGITYDYLWEKSLVGDWVLITSFNEWHEGTEIEPSEEYGNYFIDQTRYWANIFKSP